MSVRAINDDQHFQGELATAGIKLVVVDFTATWLGFLFFIFVLEYAYFLPHLGVVLAVQSLPILNVCQQNILKQSF